jgi:tetratricopeptide (TPR) repeat protein
MTALWAYAGYAEKRRAGQPGMREYALALGAFAAGLMSKPMLVTLPCVLLLLDFWPLRRATTGDGAKMNFAAWGKLLAEKIPFLALSAVSSGITVIAQTKSGALSTVLSLDERLANAACAVVRYGAKFLIPVDLAVLYPHPGRWPAGEVGLAVGCITAVSAVAIWQWRRRPWLLFGWLWFLGTLVPVSGLVQVGVQSMADRYTYVPMLGVQMALLWTWRDAVGPASWRTATGVALIILASFAARTFGQIGVWKNSLTLFDQAIAVTEKNYVAYDNRGLYLYKAGRIDEAMQDYRAALAINPGYLNANNNLGHAFYELGRPAEAIPLLRVALKAEPSNLEVRNNLANALSDVGQLAEASEHYDYVLARQPHHRNALNGSAVLLAMQNRPAEAKSRLELALRLDPDNASAHANFGNVCSMLNLRDEALDHYRRAIVLNPKDAHTHSIIGTLLNDQGKSAEAVVMLQRSLALRPNHPDTLAQLGLALVRIGRREEGMRAWRTALEVQPGHLQAATWLKAAAELK